MAAYGSLDYKKSWYDSPSPKGGIIPAEPAILTPGALKWLGVNNDLLDWQDWLDKVGEVQIGCGGDIRYVLDNGYIVRTGTNHAGVPWEHNDKPLCFVAAPLPVVGEKWVFYFIKPLGSSVVTRKTGTIKDITLREDIDD